MPAGANRREPSWGDVADAGTALWDMGAGALRGVSAATIGLPGDLEHLARQFTMGGENVLPTTEDVKKKLPVVTTEKPRRASAAAGEAFGQNFPQPQLALKTGMGYAKGIWDAAGKISDATPKGQINMFFGPSAKKADLVALQEAKSLQASGEAPEDIWAKTGWFEHPKDGWKFEVSDHNVAFRGLAEAREQRPKEFAQLGVYEDAIWLKDKMVNEGMTMDQAQRAYQQQNLHKPTIMAKNFAENNEMQSLIDRRIATQAKVFAPMESTGQKMLPHEGAYEQMPELAGREFATANLPPGVRGQAFSHSGRVELNRALMQDTEQARSTGLHEMQHQVQDSSGWQPGTNPDSILRTKNTGANAPSVVQARNLGTQALNDATESSNIIATAREVRDTMEQTGMDAHQALMDVVIAHGNHYGKMEHFIPGGRFYDEVVKLVGKHDHSKLQSLSNEAWKDVQAAQKTLDKIPHPISKQEAHALYERTYGETEARVVQNRRDLTPEQRRTREQFPMYDYKEASPRGMLTKDEVYDPMKRIMP